jgi:chromosome segregation ATPase
MASFLRQSQSVTSQVASLIAVLLLSSHAHAQQPAPRKRTPSLTTETVVKPADQPASEIPSEVLVGKTGDSGPTDAPPQNADDKVTAEEQAWREQIAKARDRAKAAERAAEEGELRITALRNQLGASGQTPQARNETAAELNQAGQQLTALRASARAAAEELGQIVEVGRLNKYSEARGPDPTLKNGSANQDYYKSRYAALSEALQAAERRVQLYDDRVRDASQRILQTGGKDGGDNFYIAHLQQERQEAQQQLDEAREASVKARSDLDALKEEARRAGVPPGVFR